MNEDIYPLRDILTMRSGGNPLLYVRNYRDWAEDNTQLNLGVVKKLRTSGRIKEIGMKNDLPYVPVALILSMFKPLRKMFFKSRRTAKIAVIYSIEMAIFLHAMGFDHITLICCDENEELTKVCSKFNITYSVVEEVIGMKFDVVVGNPPYEKNLYKRFVELSTTIAPIVVMVIPTTWTAGSKSKPFRTSIVTFGLKAMTIYPMGTFKTIGKNNKVKDVMVVPSVLYLDQDHSGLITFTRRTKSGHSFTWNHEPVPESEYEFILYYSDVGKDIWNKAAKYPHKLSVGKVSNYRKFNLDTIGPNVNVMAKNHTSYLGYTDKSLALLRGTDMQMGRVDDVSGDCTKMRESIKLYKTNSRYVWPTEHPINLGKWMSCKLFGIIMSMTGVESNNTPTTLGRMPKIVLPGVFDTEEEFNEAIYRELKLNEVEIKWVEDFGK